MNNKCKKICSGLLAATLVGSAISLAACGGEVYKGEKLDGYQTPTAAATSNGGFAVEYGDYVYFINGMENYTASNEYGEATKGALMRIKTTDLNGELSSADYNKAETVVPMLFVAQNFDSGIYIYGDYVYFAAPTTDKSMSGDAVNSWIDFKRAKLDGTETMKDYYFRLSDNAAKYRFVQVPNVDENGDGENDVFCLYEETNDKGANQLKSYNTATKTTTVLVSGAKSAFFYDKNDLTNPNVYYTMSVADNAESPNPPPTASYDQLYCVNAAATVESVDADKASYTVKGGKTYDFNETYMQEKNDEAEESDDGEEELPYDFEDYTTYPYVNLGNLVLDGIGDDNVDNKTQFNETKEADPIPYAGYTYTIQSVQNGGVYLTRAEVFKPGSTEADTSLYYLKDVSGEWNAISGNAEVVKIAPNTTNTASAILYKNADNTQEYLYISGDALYRAGQPNATTGEVKTVRLATGMTGATLYKVQGNYLYYYNTIEGVKCSLSRIDYTGTEDKYDNLLGLGEEAYKPVTVSYIAWNNGWYKPEIFGDTVLYSSAETFGSGSTAYNYVYAAKIDDIKGDNEKYDAVIEEIDSFADNADLKAAMTYYFRTGSTKAYDAVKDLYDEYQQEKFAEFVENETFAKERDFIALIGAMTEEDEEAIYQNWVDSLRSETEEVEEDEGMPTWAIILISVGGGLIFIAAVVFVLKKRAKKRAAAREAEATVNAYKRKKIDTTDDKSIDVYADEDETTEEVAEEPVEETAEETVAETEDAEDATDAADETKAVDAVEADEKKDE